MMQPGGRGNAEVQLPHIVNYASMLYEQLALYKMRNELLALKDPNWSTKENRYYIARIFTIVGELLREMFEDKEHATSEAKKVFNDIIGIKDKLIHCHKKIIMDVTSTEELNYINNLIYEISLCLISMIKNDLVINDRLYLDEETLAIRKLKTLVTPFKKFIEGKSSKTEIKEVLSQQPADATTAPNKVSQLLKKINEEIQYLKSVEASTHPSKDYIIQHITSIIGQLVKDIESNKDLHFSEMTLPVSIEASKSAKTARNQELSHNPLALDPEKLCERIKNDILPAESHFRAFSIVHEFKCGKTTDSTVAFYELGQALLRIEHPDAIHYLEKTVATFNKDPSEVTSIKLRNTEAAMGVPSGVLRNMIDTTEISTGIEPYALRAQVQLAYTYLKAENYDKARSVLLPTISKINYKVKLTLLEDKKVLSDVFHAINIYALSLCYEDRNEEAAQLLEQFMIFDKDGSMAYNLASCYRKLGLQEDADQILQRLKDDSTNPIVQFGILMEYSTKLISSDSNKLESYYQVIEYTKEIEKILQSNLPVFKIHSNDYWSYSLKIYHLELLAIESIIALKTPLSSQVLKGSAHDLLELSKIPFVERIIELEKKVKEIKTKIDSIQKSSDKITEIFFTFTNIFAGIVTGYNDSHYSNITKAQQYFNCANNNGASNLQALKETAGNLATMYSHYAMFNITSNHKLALCLLNKALEIQTKYDLNLTTTLHNLGVANYKLALQIKAEAGAQDPKTTYDLILSCLQKAVNFCSQAESAHNSSGTTIPFELLESLANSLEFVGYLQQDISLIRKSISYLDMATKIPSTLREQLIADKKNCLHDITAFLQLLLLALEHNLTISSHEELGYFFAHYATKFSIQYRELESEKVTLTCETKDKSILKKYQKTIIKELKLIRAYSTASQDCIVIHADGSIGLEQIVTQIHKECEITQELKKAVNDHYDLPQAESTHALGEIILDYGEV